jgi:HSP20 family protein
MAGLVPFNKNTGAMKTTGFDDFYNMLDNFFEDTWAPMRRLQCDTFKLDIQEDDKEYTIDAEMPGTSKNEIKLEMVDNKLLIAVVKNEQVDEENKNFIHRERRTCSMQRSVYLKDATADSIKAKLENGILRIKIPKDTAKTSKRSISID